MRYLVSIALLAAFCLPAAAQDGDLASLFPSDTLLYAEADAAALMQGLPQLDLAKLLNDERIRAFMKPTLEKLGVDVEKPVADLIGKLPIQQYLKGRAAVGIRGVSLHVPGREKVFHFSARDPLDLAAFREILGAMAGRAAAGERADDVPIHIAIDFVLIAEPGPALRQEVQKELARQDRVKVTEVRIGERIVKHFRHPADRIEDSFFFVPQYYADFSGERWIVASQAEAFSDVVAGGPRSSLGAQPGFRSVRDRMTGGSRVFFAYADLAQAASIVRNFLAPIGAQALDLTGLDAVAGLGAGVSITQGGIRESVGLALRGETKGIWTLFDALPGGMKALQYAPPEAMVVVGAKFDGKLLVQRVKELARALAPGAETLVSRHLKDLLRGTGLDLEENVLPAFGDEIGVILLPPEGFGLVPPTVIGIDIDNEEQFRSLLAMAEEAVDETGGAVRIEEIEVIPAGAAGEAPVKGWQVLAGIPMMAPPAFAVHRGRFFGASGKDLLAKVCTEWGAEGAKALGRDGPNFARVMGALNGGRTDDLVALAYVDLKKLAPLILQGLQLTALNNQDLQRWVDFGSMPTADDIAKHVSGIAFGLRRDKQGLVVDAFSQTGVLFPALGWAAYEQARWEREVMIEVAESREISELNERAQQPEAPFVGIQSLSTDGSGITILGTFDNSPARRAGLVDKDVLLAINHQPTRNMLELRRATLKHRPGDTIRLTVKRGTETIELDLTLVRRGDFFPGPGARKDEKKTDEK